MPRNCLLGINPLKAALADEMRDQGDSPMVTVSSLRWSIRGLEIALEVGDPADALRWAAAIARRADEADRAALLSNEAETLHRRVQQAWQQLEERYRSFGEWDFVEAQHACVALDHAEAVLRRIGHHNRWSDLRRAA